MSTHQRMKIGTFWVKKPANRLCWDSLSKNEVDVVVVDVVHCVDNWPKTSKQVSVIFQLKWSESKERMRKFKTTSENDPFRGTSDFHSTTTTTSSAALSTMTISTSMSTLNASHVRHFLVTWGQKTLLLFCRQQQQRRWRRQTTFWQIGRWQLHSIRCRIK